MAVGEEYQFFVGSVLIEQDLEDERAGWEVHREIRAKICKWEVDWADVMLKEVEVE